MPPFLQSALQVLAGIGLLFGGGELFVQGSVAISLIFGIPQLVIGLTVVALGTSAPELFVSVSSVLKGSDALAVSNVVGSNIFNVLVVLGSSALVLPLRVESRLVRRDVPLLLAVSAAVWGMASAGRVTWQAGAALLIALVINSVWEIRTAREEPEEMAEAEPQISTETANGGFIKACILLLLGILLLGVGSNQLVAGASNAAKLLKVDETVIGLTIVSAGTGMPELVTSLVAALRGRTDLAIGNVVGSCLLNQLLVLGSCAVVAGGSGLLVDPLIIERDLPVMVLTTLACMPIFWTKGQISRLEGGILVGLYAFYLTDQVLNSTNHTWQDEFRLTMLCIVLPIVLIIIVLQTVMYWRDLNRLRITPSAE
ncbi:MAG: calcium/sodium antiporter [Prochlorococcus sp.]|jgi:cation:H+ antiporter|nr:calcium/sodium antiporter [Prochlorococcaceae cyanobacterium ETNP18_MAG_17]MDP7327539.1 calcium/sodium antiporter [Prochlorococcaceae cyanobacterium ETNP7_MAG_30]|tara:strand:+ start:592 stop:1701 length:1110 start_codon:yes stop_codon:yes gene_type:complete